MTEIDLHGVRVREAKEMFTSYVNRARMARESIQVRFVTGLGDIKQNLLELIKLYELDFYEEGTGVLIVMFE